MDRRQAAFTQKARKAAVLLSEWTVGWRFESALSGPMSMNALGGCLVASVQTVLDIVTFLVKTSSEGLDLAKTSQSETDAWRAVPATL